MIRFVNGPHQGTQIVAMYLSGFYRYTFPECGCQYMGCAISGVAFMEHQSGTHADVPEAFAKAFA